MFKPFFSILSNKNLSLGNVRILVIIFVRDRTARCRRPLRRGACRLQCVFKAPLRKGSCQSVKDWLRGRKRICYIKLSKGAPVAWRDGQYAQAWRLTQFANQMFAINKPSVPARNDAPVAWRDFQYANQTFAINLTSRPARYNAPLQKPFCYYNLSKGALPAAWRPRGGNVTFPMQFLHRSIHNK